MNKTGVRELFNYNPITGLLTRRIRKGRSKKGSEVGWLRKDGYRSTRIKGKDYLIHDR